MSDFFVYTDADGQTLQIEKSKITAIGELNVVDGVNQPLFIELGFGRITLTKQDEIDAFVESEGLKPLPVPVVEVDESQPVKPEEPVEPAAE